MTTLEIKSDLINRINALGKNKLFEIQAYLENLENEDVELLEWIKLSSYQKSRIEDSISQLNDGKYSSHEDVINLLRQKVKNG